LGRFGKGYRGFISNSDLLKLVAQYNATIAGTLTPAGKTTIPRLAGQTYPAIKPLQDFNLGDIYNSQDLRVSKTFSFRERYKLRLIGEGFNIFNTSNVSNVNFNLLSPPGVFGQPNQRVGQTFGSGGPRAFQIAARAEF